ncbi:hypothetical protein QYE76_028700 [Lolium multiflorum]|uniref:Uncharacterized protein n=1 Tax=Lolium multiflorum TaxID=4521 RepID=A0AAD8VEU5_LOLMU|nr:hypothetical protein QYE76_028700 [Lolium multiflorum]
MDKENANPIVHDAVGSKRYASLFDVVPSTGWDPYEEVPYISPPNPYDTCMDDPWNEIWSSAVRLIYATTSAATTRTGHQDVSYFAKGVYRCPFCTRRLGGTDFNCLLTHVENIGNTFPKVGTTVNPYSFRAKHKALGMHLRSFQRVEISAHASAQAQGSQGEQQVEAEADGEAAPTIDTTVAILMEKKEELSLECDRLRDDLAAKKKNSKTLVELICNLHNERDMLKNELIKQRERNIASAEKASSILKTVCLEKDKSDIEYKILLQDKVELQKLNLEYADIAILALLERQKAQDKLMHLMLESCSEREETLKERVRGYKIIGLIISRELVLSTPPTCLPHTVKTPIHSPHLRGIDFPVSNRSSMKTGIAYEAEQSAAARAEDASTVVAVAVGEASPGTQAARLLCFSDSSTSVATGVLAVTAGHHGEVFLGPVLDADLDPFDDFGPNVQFQEDVEGDDEEEYYDDMDDNKVRRDQKSRYVLKQLKGGEIRLCMHGELFCPLCGKILQKDIRSLIQHAMGVGLSTSGKHRPATKAKHASYGLFLQNYVLPGLFHVNAPAAGPHAPGHV